ncbi:MAG TPA: hypothetical protein VGV37_01300 [Aliidongia sp.]|uniref:hypothetical protein n=1 Tax=Aliidongia sp. TaxID=1914230 RepID=UPI002DDD9608|nr:hypothetical protein [Aliidongia sp.]HEV2673144.1 hypothetical protein [Aliidongia sp.]
MKFGQILALAGTFLAFIGSANADPINFSTTGYSITGIGAEFQTDYDSFTVTGLSGIVNTNAATPVEIGTYSFTVGPNCYACTQAPSGFTSSFTATIGTQTKSILLPWSWSSTGPVDSLVVGSAAPVNFNLGTETLAVTGLSLGDLSSAGGTVSGNIFANFDFRPLTAAFAANNVAEPVSIAVFGVGLVGFGVMAIRRRRKSATPV